MLDDDALHALWLQAVALYDDSANPPPDFASVSATRRALRHTALVDLNAFDAVVVAVLGHAMHERGDAALLDFEQARGVGLVALLTLAAVPTLLASFACFVLRDSLFARQFCDVMAALMPASPRTDAQEDWR